jgi:ABC-type multidrug transport system fused ATPase/permease subunit
LLLTLLGFLDYSGTIEIDGTDVSHLPKPLLRSRITTISQDAVQLQGSVRENLLPYEGQANDGKLDDTAVLRTLVRVGLSEAISSKGGIDASLSDMSLSEGQMQFLCLARAILHNLWTGGKLVLMDEPTSNMDYETDARIQSLVREVFTGCTLIMISHRPDAIADVDVHLDVTAGKVTRRADAAVPAESVREE